MILFPVLFPLTPETLKAFWQSASIDEMPTQGLLEEIHGSRYRRTRALLHQKTQPEPAKISHHTRGGDGSNEDSPTTNG